MLTMITIVHADLHRLLALDAVTDGLLTDYRCRPSAYEIAYPCHNFHVRARGSLKIDVVYGPNDLSQRTSRCGKTVSSESFMSNDIVELINNAPRNLVLLPFTLFTA